MTVQRRLLISNVLMLAIPAVFAVFMALGGLFLVFVSVFPNAEYRLGVQNELLETRSQTVELVTSWLDEVNLEQKREVEQQISQLLDKNQMILQVWEGKTALWQREGETIPFQAQLEQSLAALDGQGTVSNGTYDLFGVHLSSQGTDYQLRLYNPVVSLSHDTLKSWGIGIGLFLIVLLLFVVVLTNRFLTRFVFRHIAQPLKILGEGVHQIRDGNLTYRISYTEPDEFRPICEDFNDMAGRLRDSVSRSQKEEESRKELLAGISHDIRSPLTAIQAYVEGLLDGVADTEEKRTAYLSIIQKKSVEMDEMVRKLFLFSKMDMGEYPYNPEELDAVKEIGDFVKASAGEYRRRGLAVQVGPLPAKAIIFADPTYFRSILMNLLDNSAKYKKKETGSATITGGIAGQTLHLYVDDDGPGVPSEALPKLFDVFYRNDPSRKNPKQGSGLGLAIVWKAIERMGGSIRGENLPQGGLRMAMEIPLAERRQKK